MFYEAIYLPKETDNLSEDARKHIGDLIGIQEGGKIPHGPTRESRPTSPRPTSA